MSGVDDMIAQRDEQAAQWALLIAENELTEEDWHAFEAWMTVAENRIAFEEAVFVWQGIEVAAERAELIEARSRALESLHLWGQSRMRRWRPAFAAAAALVLLCCAGLFLLTRPSVYETGVNERRSVVLADGSMLSLDAATRVEVKLAGDRRDLRLVSGRAKFAVAKDPFRPFSVIAGNKVVVATGTAFSVELLRRRMHVVLYEGRVEVLTQPGDGSKPVPLNAAGAVPAAQALMPGRELITPTGSDRASVKVVETDVSRSLSWESGQLNFAREPLASAIERMNRYSLRKFVIADESLAALKVSGVYNAGDDAAFVDGITEVLPVRVEQKGQQLVLTKLQLDEKYSTH